MQDNNLIHISILTDLPLILHQSNQDYSNKHSSVFVFIHTVANLMAAIKFSIVQGKIFL